MGVFAVTIPVGPRCHLEHLLDTVESVRFYCGPCTVVLINDTGRKLPQFGAVVVNTEGEPGTSGGLLHNLATVWKTLDADLILRLDTDALVIGPHPEDDANARFAQYPNVGLLGSYKVTCIGTPRTGAAAALSFRKTTSRLNLLLHHRRTAALLAVIKRANRHGYELGDHVLGGAYFISRACVERIRHDVDGRFLHVQVSDDYLLSLFVRACGMDIGDFAYDGPLGLAWKGLPTSPDELVRMGKKIIHSVRNWQTMDEDGIRNYFRARRRTQVAV